MIKKFLKFFAPEIALNYYRNKTNKIRFKEWEENGCLLPAPHLIKQLTIKEYKKKYKYELLVETGTYTGEMVEAQRKIFKKIYSIELSTELYEAALERFSKENNIVIINGDSGKVLSELISQIDEPAIFWLDGHYSGGITARGEKECPIFEELDAIFCYQKFNHILLIDDARCFTGKGDYPTIELLEKYVKSKNHNYKLQVKHDIIRFVV